MESINSGQMLKRKHESSHYFLQDDKELIRIIIERQNSRQPYIQTQTRVLPRRKQETYPEHWKIYVKQ